MISTFCSSEAKVGKLQIILVGDISQIGSLLRLVSLV